MVKLVEDKLRPPLYYPPKPANPPNFTNPTLPKPTHTYTHTHTTTSTHSKLPIKRLTPAEMAAQRERGLCFNCDDKVVPGHCCKPPQFLCLLAEDEDEE